MTKNELYRNLTAKDRDTSFLANVIMTSQPNPARKLRGLWNLIQANRDVRSGNTIDQIRIDGHSFSYAVLDNPANFSLYA